MGDRLTRRPVDARPKAADKNARRRRVYGQLPEQSSLVSHAAQRNRYGAPD